MARDRDDDRDDRDDRDDDRPRRRRDNDDPPKKKGGVGVVLLIVGLAVGIPLLICGGVGIWLYMKGKEFVTNVGGTIQADLAATAFLNSLEFDNIDGAYESTTSNFKTTTTKDQFTKLVKANPVLTSSHTARVNGAPTPTGTAPNRKATLTFNVTPGFSSDTTPPTGAGKPPATIGKGPDAPVAAKAITCTITVAEQADGTWKVDGFTVP